MNLDDPKLTAYALDELSPEEKSKIEAELRQSPEGRRIVAETEQLAKMLTAEYGAAAGNELLPPANLVDIRDDPWFWSIARPLSIAAVLALAAVIGATVVARYKMTAGAGHGFAVLHNDSSGPTKLPLPPADVRTFAEVEAEVTPQIAATPPGGSQVERTIVLGSNIPTAEETGPYSPTTAAAKQSRGRVLAGAAVKKERQFLDEIASHYAAVQVPAPESPGGIRKPDGDFNTAAYDHIVENPFLDAASNPLSTFSIDVDTASYSNVRRFINNGSLPPKDAIRIEEMINYFTYDYPQPDAAKPFSINVD
ncbi:MAG: Ca-activated chloride channel, partial [Verrucomicrobiota bacterium]